MPVRYTICAPAEKIAERFKIRTPDDVYRPRYNAAPAQLLPVIANSSKGGLSYFYWGTTPGWSKNKSISPKLTNADAETLNTKASFKNALEKRRCLIPADGFYEWKRITKKGRIPYRIVLNDNSLFTFAGLWEEFEDEDERVVHTFTIITTSPNSMMSSIHDRMPVILTPSQETAWLDEDTPKADLQEMLRPYPADQMGNYTVSSRINDVSNEGPNLIHPCTPADQFGNYSLFD